ncbi:hypothetical protein HELRODRAFT_169447 [Helobdella robusta]|uniref:Cilia- and flagella-associated protein 69 ARM repeats domain-containing protein n=1 Tax=Helobdella robusta TaxID=6412 RepID=T1F1Y0_HELRO|nr:hypothetical protein HELRODRAFT_169447 [Helobdella robusta]ESO08572.1 hypothetical protein HELRODRAFT_169447 [Helobdella robusta]
MAASGTCFLHQFILSPVYIMNSEITIDKMPSTDNNNNINVNDNNNSNNICIIKNGTSPQLKMKSQIVKNFKLDFDLPVQNVYTFEEILDLMTNDHSYLKDLTVLFKIVNECNNKLHHYPQFMEALAEIINICRLPFLMTLTSDELTFKKIAIECIEQLGYLMRFHDDHFISHICFSLNGLYNSSNAKEPPFNIEGVKQTTERYNRMLMDESDLAESVAKFMLNMRENDDLILAVLTLTNSISQSECNSLKMLQSDVIPILCNFFKTALENPSRKKSRIVFLSVGVLLNLAEFGPSAIMSQQFMNTQCLSNLRECTVQYLLQSYSVQDKQLRNDLISLVSMLLTKCCNVPLVEMGFVKMLTLFATFQEVKSHNLLVKHMKLYCDENEDYELKLLLIDIIMLMIKIPGVVKVYRECNLIQCLLCYANNPCGRDLFLACPQNNHHGNNNSIMNNVNNNNNMKNVNNKNNNKNNNYNGCNCRIKNNHNIFNSINMTTSGNSNNNSNNNDSVRICDKNPNNIATHCMDSLCNNLDALNTDNFFSKHQTVTNFSVDKYSPKNMQHHQLQHQLKQRPTTTMSQSRVLQPRLAWNAQQFKEIQQLSLLALSQVGPLMLDDVVACHLIQAVLHTMYTCINRPICSCCEFMCGCSTEHFDLQNTLMLDKRLLKRCTTILHNLLLTRYQKVLDEFICCGGMNLLLCMLRYLHSQVTTFDETLQLDKMIVSTQSDMFMILSFSCYGSKQNKNAPHSLRNQILGCLCDLTENPDSLEHLTTWTFDHSHNDDGCSGTDGAVENMKYTSSSSFNRNLDNEVAGMSDLDALCKRKQYKCQMTLTHLLCDLWRQEEAKLGVIRDDLGVVLSNVFLILSVFDVILLNNCGCNISRQTVAIGYKESTGSTFNQTTSQPNELFNR